MKITQRDSIISIRKYDFTLLNELLLQNIIHSSSNDFFKPAYYGFLIQEMINIGIYSYRVNQVKFSYLLWLLQRDHMTIVSPSFCSLILKYALLSALCPYFLLCYIFIPFYMHNFPQTVGFEHSKSFLNFFQAFPCLTAVQKNRHYCSVKQSYLSIERYSSTVPGFFHL